MFSSLGIDAEVLENVRHKRKRQFGKLAIVMQGFKELTNKFLHYNTKKER
jgi:diacylglycerol kinase family enzyme